MGKSVKTYSLNEGRKLAADINARHRLLLEQAVPLATKQALDAVTAKGRTRMIKYARVKASVPRWAIAKKLPRKLQRKASLAEWKRTKRMSAKSHVLTNGITMVSLFGTRKNPTPPEEKMKSIQKARSGVKAPKQQRVKDAFVGKGEKRIRDRSYDNYLREKQNAGPATLRGKNWQVMRRTGKKAYPVEIVKVEIEKFAGRALDSYTNRVYRREYGFIFERQLEFNLNNKVRF